MLTSAYKHTLKLLKIVFSGDRWDAIPDILSLAKLWECNHALHGQRRLLPRVQLAGLREFRSQAWIPGAQRPALPQATRPPLQLCCLRAESHTHESSLFAGMHLPEGRLGWVSFRVATEPSRADWVTLGAHPWPRHPGPGECTGGWWRGQEDINFEIRPALPCPPPPRFHQHPTLWEPLGWLLKHGTQKTLPWLRRA